MSEGFTIVVVHVMSEVFIIVVVHVMSEVFTVLVGVCGVLNFVVSMMFVMHNVFVMLVRTVTMLTDWPADRLIGKQTDEHREWQADGWTHHIQGRLWVHTRGCFWGSQGEWSPAQVVRLEDSGHLKEIQTQRWVHKKRKQSYLRTSSPQSLALTHYRPWLRGLSQGL